MSSYLLGTEALVALAGGNASEAVEVKKWLDAITAQDQLFASEISLGEIRWTVERDLDPLDRDKWRHRLDSTIPQRFGSNLLPLKREEIRRWGLIRLLEADGVTLSAEETQIIAQAMTHDLILVAPQSPVHEVIGVTVFDPYNGAPWP